MIIQDGGVGLLCRLLGFGMMTDCSRKVGRAMVGGAQRQMESVLTNLNWSGNWSSDKELDSVASDEQVCQESYDIPARAIMANGGPRGFPPPDTGLCMRWLGIPPGYAARIIAFGLIGGAFLETFMVKVWVGQTNCARAHDTSPAIVTRR